MIATVTYAFPHRTARTRNALNRYKPDESLFGNIAMVHVSKHTRKPIAAGEAFLALKGVV